MRRNRSSSWSYPILSLKGFCMGSADVVPGVSGGTMALILGIYEELIAAIKSFDLKAVRLVLGFRVKELMDRVHWRFLLALGIGILAAIFSLSKLIAWLLTNEPVFIWSFFFGLVLASVYTVSGRIGHWNATRIFLVFLGAGGAYFLVGLVPLTTPNQPWFIFLSGAVAICAMILPGISGSFILVLLGKYHYILEAVNQRNIVVLLIFTAGTATGLILFSRLLGWLLKKHHDPAICLLCGLMLGSLRKVWPWKDAGGNILPEQINGETILACLLALAGMGAVVLLDRLAKNSTR